MCVSPDVLLANMQLPCGFRTALRDESFTKNFAFIHTKWQQCNSSLNVILTHAKSLLEDLPLDALVLFSDEAHFHTSGCVNKQNMHYWSEDNP